jgi:transposase
MVLAIRGAYECRTGLRTSSNDVKKWTVADVEAALDDSAAVLGITCLLEPVRVLTEQIRAIEKEAVVRARLRDEFAPLQTVWGIGRTLALTIMYEVGDISRFRKVGNFASYCRLVKTARLSVGKPKGKGNRRNGNPYLSWAFSEAAHFAVRYHDIANRYYQRKRSKTNGIIAIRALAHKLARASYHVMRNQEAFDPTKTFA